MSKNTDDITALAVAIGLQYDAANSVIYGQKDGYNLLIYGEISGPSRYYATNFLNNSIYISTSAKRSTGGPLSEDELMELGFKMSMKVFTHVSKDGNTIKADFSRANVAQDALKDILRESLSALISFLNTKGYQPCCSTCGQCTEIAGFKADLTYMHLCPECESQARRNAKAIADRQNRSDNVVGGIIGAVLGSLVGVAVIMLLSLMGFAGAVISGILMGYGVLRGYELLGGNLSKKGVVISVVIMVIMTYVGDRMGWAVRVYQEFHSWGLSYTECYKMVPDLLRIGTIEAFSYIGNLIILYVFLWISAVFTIRIKVPSGRIVKIGHMNKYNIH